MDRPEILEVFQPLHGLAALTGSPGGRASIDLADGS